MDSYYVVVRPDAVVSWQGSRVHAAAMHLSTHATYATIMFYFKDCSYLIAIQYVFGLQVRCQRCPWDNHQRGSTNLTVSSSRDL